jgi:branched-chain amino acid transport system ATP-binding protein
MLEAKGISAGYGIVPVLRDVSVSVHKGEIVLIVGENGAGKSTLLRTIGGFIKPEQGQVLLGGEDVTGQSPEKLVRKGLRLVLDGHRVFPEISVWDNLRLGAAAKPGDKTGFNNAVENILTVFPILKEKLRNYARDLSGGQQQMLALGQAFVAQPQVLLCDEPSTGLAQALLPPILTFLKNWAASGTAIIIVEQHIDIALPVADRAVVIERGQVKLSCAAADLKEELRKASEGRATAGLPA